MIDLVVPRVSVLFYHPPLVIARLTKSDEAIPPLVSLRGAAGNEAISVRDSSLTLRNRLRNPRRLPRPDKSVLAITKNDVPAIRKTSSGWTLLADRGILAGTSSKPLL